MERSIKGHDSSSLLPLERIQPLLNNKSSFLLLETQRVDEENCFSYLFVDPVRIITCFNFDAVPQTFQYLERFLSRGYWAAGFFSYELGYGWEDFRIKRRFSFPLIWLGIFECPLIFDHLRKSFLTPMLSCCRGDVPFRFSGYQIKYLRLNESIGEYIRNIQRIKNYIAQGLTYQVNYTIKCKFEFQGSSLALYKNLRDAQPVAYSALIRDRRFELLSFSPELFFRKKGKLITVRPMKGTISRGRTVKEDEFQIRSLKASVKDRSENVMIVDLLRNDLGRIAEIGSVKVSKLYTVEKYKTLFQMTSTIQAKLRDNVSFYELFRNIFPSGSVTGAPKIETMKIIKELERRERRVYTGAVGFFKPNRDAVFNVAIRTILLRGTTGEMGIGSGIVFDSDPQREYKECELKAQFFVMKRRVEFHLIETIRWSKKTGFFLLPYHLQRLKSSAKYFDFLFNEMTIKQKLKSISRCLNPAFHYRVRLLLSKEGNIHISYRRIRREFGSHRELRVTFSGRSTDSSDIFLYHKTTNRRLYNQEYCRARRAGFFEIIFENEKGEVTEGCISNIFIRLGDVYYTPPVSCGLLEGVYRKYFIEKKAPFVKERVLRREDLFKADAVYLTNAVRGITRVRLL